MNRQFHQNYQKHQIHHSHQIHQNHMDQQNHQIYQSPSLPMSQDVLVKAFMPFEVAVYTTFLAVGAQFCEAISQTHSLFMPKEKESHLALFTFKGSKISFFHFRPSTF